MLIEYKIPSYYYPAMIKKAILPLVNSDIHIIGLKIEKDKTQIPISNKTGNNIIMWKRA